MTSLLNFQPGERHPDMVRAHADASVTKAALSFLARPSDGMLRLLTLSMTKQAWDPRSFGTLINDAGIPDGDRPNASDLLSAMREIALKEPREAECGRGAVLEKVTAGLLARRGHPVLEEHCAEGFPEPPWRKGLSPPLDFVLEEPIEIYDSKVDLTVIEPTHLNVFAILRDIDWRANTAFATLQKASTLADWLAGLGNGPVHAFTQEDFLAMSVRGPTTVVL